MDFTCARAVHWVGSACIRFDLQRLPATSATAFNTGRANKVRCDPGDIQTGLDDGDDRFAAAASARGGGE